MSVLTDIIDGSQLQETEDGLTAVRVAYVDEVTGDKSARQYMALTTSGVPQIGDAHPSIPELVCTNKAARSAGKSTSKFYVTCTYKNASASVMAPDIQIGAGVTSTQTTRDANGNQIITRWTFADRDSTGEIVESGERARVHTIEKQTPVPTYRVQMRLSSSPFALAQAYVGKIGGWGGSVVPMWLCSRIEGSLVGDGEYDVSFEFQYAADELAGWSAEIEEVGTNGQPLPGGGVQYVEVYPRADFKKLPVPKP